MASDTEAESFWEKEELSEDERKKIIYNLLKKFMSTAQADIDASEELGTSFSYQARDDFVRNFWNKYASKKEIVVAVTDASEKCSTEDSEMQKNLRQTSDLDTNLTTSTNVDGEVERSEFEDVPQKYAGDDCQVAASSEKKP